MPLFKIYESQNKLIRSLKLRDYFSKNANNNKYNIDTRNSFRLASTWTPPDHHVSQNTLDTIQHIVSSTEACIDKYRTDKLFSKIIYNSKSNISNSEKTSLNDLRNNTFIIIKPADKGGATVVLNRSSYLSEAYRQLNNCNYYLKLNEPLYRNNVPKINAILNKMLYDKIINLKQFQYLQAKDSDRERIFYLLPKIHKPKKAWPQTDMPEGRPIVSDCGSESYRISQYIDSFVRPISMKHPAFIKDTYDFISKIRNQVIPSNSFLVTGDVSSLYTNMRFDRTLTTVSEAFNKTDMHSKLKGYLLELLEITLKNNDFQFNGEYYLQTCGTAMGKSYAPGLADLYMQEIDSSACQGIHGKLINYYFRFLDDIFFVWLGSREHLNELETYLNSIIPGIKITFNINIQEINFLDTTIYKGNEGNKSILLTKVYFKETDTHQLLHRKSFHPKHVFKGILKSQLLRFKRISSTFSDYNTTCQILFRALSKRGYSKSLLRKTKREVWLYSSNAIIKRENQQENQLLPIIIPFSNTGSALAKNWKSIIKLNCNFDNFKLITAYTNSTNLHKKLVSSSMINSIMERPLFSLNNISNEIGVYKCNNIRCKACNYIKTGNTFQSSHNKRTFKIKHFLTCKSCNIIYLINCTKCGKQYVGQTGRRLADRINDHLSRIRTKKPTPTGLHFNLSDHSADNMEIMAIEQVSTCHSPLQALLTKEATWQNLLQTAYPLGLNNLKPSYIQESH
jgi:hypothetical protein